jgi:hypothetical protein
MFAFGAEPACQDDCCFSAFGDCNPFHPHRHDFANAAIAASRVAA